MSLRCAQCGLSNQTADASCARCGARLSAGGEGEARPAAATPPTYSYVLAILSGVLAFAALAMTQRGKKLSHSPELSDIVLSGLKVLIVVGGTYAFLGALFGYLWPAGRWRWGGWVSAPLLLLLAWALLSLNIFALVLGAPVYALIVLLACAGAHLAANVSGRAAGGS
jgi:hypothetical protein